MKRIGTRDGKYPLALLAFAASCLASTGCNNRQTEDCSHCTDFLVVVVQLSEHAPIGAQLCLNGDIVYEEEGLHYEPPGLVGIMFDSPADVHIEILYEGEVVFSHELEPVYSGIHDSCLEVDDEPDCFEALEYVDATSLVFDPS